MLQFSKKFQMFSAKFPTIYVVTNSSLGIVSCFFDNVGLLGIDTCFIPDGCGRASCKKMDIKMVWVAISISSELPFCFYV